MSFPSVMKKPNWLSLQMLALRMRLHIVNCEIHPDEKVVSYFEGPTAFNIDCEIEEPQMIFELLANSLYMRYSGLLILINCYCSCRNKILSKILKAIESNKYLVYKLKLIYTSYDLDYDYKDHPHIWETYFTEHVKNLATNYELERNDEDEIPIDIDKLIDSYEMRTKHITPNDTEPLKDYFNFNLSQLENTLLFQEFIREPRDYFDRTKTMDYILYISDCLPLISAQELCTFFPDADYALAVQSKGNAELYFYNVNPAMAIINNNYMFTNNKPGCSVREGSEKDVQKIIRELKIARIPFILTEDFSRSQLLNFVKYLSKKNLKALKSLIFFMMTHATSNNIIYTHDGELNFIEDILKPIQSNGTLNDTNISFVNVQCRGGLNAPNSDPDEFDLIQPTQIEQLLPNAVVFYSVPDLVISPRRPTKGTPFVESFCKSFREISPQTDIKTFRDKTWNYLRKDSYYSYLDCFGKSSELIVGDSTKLYSLKPRPTSATDIISLVETIKDEFRDLNNMKQRDDAYSRPVLEIYKEYMNRNKKDTMTLTSETVTTTFCICTNVNEKKFSKNLEKLNYFASKLDEDVCTIEEC